MGVELAIEGIKFYKVVLQVVLRAAGRHAEQTIPRTEAAISDVSVKQDPEVADLLATPKLRDGPVRFCSRFG